MDLGQVKKRSLAGVFSLVSRSFLVQIISQLSLLFLTIFLDPKTFGVFFLVSAFVSFFTYFSDVGLAAALIQKKEKLDDEELKTTFFVQETLVLVLFVAILFCSSLARKWYGLDDPAVFLLYMLGFSFFLSSLKTIPSILLERKLKFNLLIIPQLLETLVFNIVSVILAWRGFGVISFAWAVLARGLVGLAAMYCLSPWRPGLAFSKKSLKKLLKFGVPYQANTIVAVIKDDLMTVFLGRIIGTTGLGYLGWAKKWAEQPLRFFMDNVSKVAFPAFSRLQDDKGKLKAAVEKSIFYLCFLTFPILVGFSLLASDLVKIIPRYLKWQPALHALYFYCFNSAWATVSTSMTNLLNAIGKIKTTFKLMLMWLGLTWLLMPALALRYGFNGVAIASALIAISSLVAIIAARKHVNFDLLGTVGKPLFSSLIMGLFIGFIKINFNSLALSISFRVLMGILVYFSFLYLLTGKLLFIEIKQILHEIKQKN